MPPDNCYARLIERGFEALPELVEHLDDLRLTRFRHDRKRSVDYQRYEDSQGYHTVGHMVSSILYWYTGEQFGSHKVRARAWARSARRGDEAAQLLGHVLEGPQSEAESNPEPDPVNEQVLLALSRRHPELLAAVYRRLLETRPELDSGSVAEAILDAPLTLRWKIEALLPAAAGDELQHAETAVRAMLTLDPHRAVDLYLRRLRMLPLQPEGNGLKRVSEFVGLLVWMDDRRAWEGTQRFMQGLDPYRRMEMLGALGGDSDKVRGCRNRRALIAGFLDDKGKAAGEFWSWPEGARPRRWKTKEIRNWATLALAVEMRLAVPLPPEEGPDSSREWTAAEWERLRGQVRAVLRDR
jgi:hypothetical protein